MTGSNTLLLPLLAQVTLVIVVYLRLGQVKSRAYRAEEVDRARSPLNEDAWPDYVRQVNNNIRNQFEVPVLFYVVTMVLWATGTTGWLAHTLAWTFVISRIIHAFIHTGSNYVPRRRMVFMFGVLIVLLMTLLAGWAVVAR